NVISREVRMRHENAFAPREVDDGTLDPGGVYQWRANGERHLLNPWTIHLPQQATRKGDYEVFRQYSKLVDDQSREFYTLRGLMEFKTNSAKSIPIEEVEPIEAIMKRFKTGAMSYGSISKE